MPFARHDPRIARRPRRNPQASRKPRDLPRRRPSCGLMRPVRLARYGGFATTTLKLSAALAQQASCAGPSRWRGWFDAIELGAAAQHRDQFRLDLDRDDFARLMQRGDRQRDDAGSRAEFQYAIVLAHLHEAGEQNRIDREPITVARLDDADCPPRIASQVSLLSVVFMDVAEKESVTRGSSQSRNVSRPGQHSARRRSI